VPVSPGPLPNDRRARVVAKTLIVQSLGEILELEFHRIQFTPDLMPSDITESEILEDSQDGKRTFRFVRGPVNTQLLLADEINRTPPKTQAALLEAMQERRVTIAGQTYNLDSPFFVLATQNPVEQEGTYVLPEAQVDRFMFCLKVAYPSKEEEVEMVLRTTGGKPLALEKLLSGPEIIALQEAVRQIHVPKAVAEFAVSLVHATRPHDGAAEIINYQLFKGKKPGAEVQGVHDRDKNPDTGKPEILMATQQYGSGQVCVLGTDSLWRWKLSQPAESKDVEIFWQNLLNWLVRGRRNAHQFDHPASSSFAGKTLTIRVQAQTKDSVLVLSAQGPDQQTKACALNPAGDCLWEAEWTPDQAGDWILIAEDEKGLRSEHLLSVEKQSPAGEFNSPPPDEEKMRKLAQMTGGDLVGNDIPVPWKEPKPQEDEASVTEVRKPLWHHGWLLDFCLVCYSFELLTKRRWRML
jgi:hypothetical protein